MNRPAVISALGALLLITGTAPLVANPYDVRHDPDYGWVDWQGMPLTPQTPDFPSQSLRTVDVARITGRDPRIDGLGLDDVWQSVEFQRLALMDPVTGQESGKDLELKVFHNGAIFYTLVRWADSTFHDVQAPWVWDAAKAVYAMGAEREDALAVLLKTYGDFNGDRLLGRGYAADEWRWGAALTNPSGYAEDRWRVLLRAKEKGLQQEVLTGADGKTKYYLTREPDQGRLCWKRTAKPERFEGQRVLSHLPQEPEHSAGDVRARGVFSPREGWTVEFARHMKTYAEDDLQIGAGSIIEVAFRVQDGAGGAWVTAPLGLRLLD